MPKLRGYECLCGEHFEYLHMGDADPAVCKCGRTMTVDEERLGGAIFHVIVPMYRGSLCHKAGYVHKYQNVPAEKTYVQVPAAKKN